MGFEPTTLGLGSQCSTTELISQYPCNLFILFFDSTTSYKLNCTANITHIRGFSRKKQEFFKISSLFCLFICGSQKNALHLHSQKPRCHSSVGRAKDWKSLCPRFDSWWHHKKDFEISQGLFLFWDIIVSNKISLSAAGSWLPRKLLMLSS